MMPPYPFFGFPPFRRPMPYIQPYNNIHNTHINYTKNEQNPCSPKTTPNKEQGNCKNYSDNTNNIKNNNIINIENNSEECFEIFGIKLYFDDLLILTLLFFLYQEEVKDTYLYIALILLLLS